MTTININLPVKDLAVSRSFFEAIGLTINEDFSDENMLAVPLSDDIRVLLLTREYFGTFTPKPIADTSQGIETILAIGVDQRADVDAMADAAAAAGSEAHREPQDLGFLYSRSFVDPDGHVWEAVHMDFSGARA